MFNLIAFFIVIFGGINWFCIGLFQFDIIAGIFGSQAHFVSRFLYCIIGICAIYSIIALPIKKGKIYEPKKKQKDEQDETSNDETENTNETKEAKTSDDTENEQNENEEDIDEIVLSKTKKKRKNTKSKS